MNLRFHFTGLSCFFLLLQVLCVIKESYAQLHVVKYSNEFLSIGVGARALGMSNSIVGSVNDGSAGFWNPAGLAHLEGNLQINLMHSEYFAGIAKYDYGSIAARIDNTGTIGISFIRFAVDDIPDTSELIDANGNINYDRVRSFTAADYAFMFSYAKKSKIEGLNYGGSAKIIHRVVGPFATAWGFGIDAGAQYQKGNMRYGLFAKDITTTYNAWNFTYTDALKETFIKTGNALPQNSLEITLPKIIAGIGYKRTISGKFTALGEIDFDMTTDGKRNVLISSKRINIDPHVGLELGYDNFLFLRAGLGNIQQVRNGSIQSYTIQPNMGIGIKLKNLTIDYALTNLGRQSETAIYSNVFSLKLDIFRHAKETPPPGQTGN
jgi:hypothetical protein